MCPKAEEAQRRIAQRLGSLGDPCPQ
eukprot:COSAG06_NODE_9818_length_1809_cov_2.678947_1_plen_25_part_10